MLRTLLAAAVALAFAGSVSAAPITIDTFDFPNPGAMYGTGTGAGTLRTNDTHGSILGQRDLVLNHPLVNVAELIRIGVATANPFLGQGIFEVNSNAMSVFSVTLNYDNFGTLDFSNDLGIALAILAYNNGSVTTQNQIVLTTATGTLTATATFPNVSPGPQSFLMPFSSFTGPGDLSQVTGIAVTFNSNNSGGFDAALDSISVVPIPEPTTWATFGALAAFGGFAARRRLRAAAPAPA